jgi:Ca-activated chloride channel homolog
MRSLCRIPLCIAGLILTVLGTASGQLSVRTRTSLARADSKPKPSIRVDSQLVLVPVSVWDRKDRPITGLEKDQFRIFDDKVEQTLTHFAMDDEPLAIGLVFDTSGSMGSKLRKSRLAVAAFLKTANPDDEFFLVEFNNRPRLAIPLTRDIEKIQNHLASAQPKGRTALFDAVYMAMHEMQKSHRRRKALLVVSDGGDNSSRYSEAELRSLVRERDVLIYTMGIYDPAGTGSRSLEEVAGPDLLEEIAGQTGGRHFSVDNLNEMPDIAAKIGVELRNRYVLGFSPSNPQRDGRYHKLSVKIVPPPHSHPAMRASWRLGYFAPGD